MEELDRFEDTVKARRSKEGTVQSRLSDIQCFREWCRSEGINNASEIDVSDIKAYLSFLGGNDYSGSVVNNRWWTLNIFFDELKSEGKIDENPLDDVDKSRYRDLFNGSKKAEYVDARGGIFALEEEGVKELADNAPNPVGRNKLIILLMYHTGVRRQELADIRLENVDRQERRIDVYSKKLDSEYTNKDPWRPVWYGPTLDPLIDKWIDIDREGYATAESPYLFIGKQTERLGEKHINDIVKEAAENAGLQEVMYTDNYVNEEQGVNGRKKHLITSHTLRHSFARACMTPDETGSRIDVKSLAELMGHSDSSVTANKYLHFAEDDIKDARELYGPR